MARSRETGQLNTIAKSIRSGERNGKIASFVVEIKENKKEREREIEMVKRKEKKINREVSR